MGCWGRELNVAGNYLHELNPSATLKVYGQEINPESYAICKSDMLITGHDASNIKFGNSFTQDGCRVNASTITYPIPLYGVEWKKVEKTIRDEHEKLGMGGRFGAGLPRVSDGSLLFLQHMISKFRKNGSGSRLAIVFNGSPLFTGSAGSGESEIRRWIIENDWLEAIVGLPDQLFYNTGISTYIWVVTNRKPKHRKGKVQLSNVDKKSVEGQTPILLCKYVDVYKTALWANVYHDWIGIGAKKALGENGGSHTTPNPDRRSTNAARVRLVAGIGRLDEPHARCENRVPIAHRARRR